MRIYQVPMNIAVLRPVAPPGAGRRSPRPAPPLLLTLPPSCPPRPLRRRGPHGRIRTYIRRPCMWVDTDTRSSGFLAGGLMRACARPLARARMRESGPAPGGRWSSCMDLYIMHLHDALLIQFSVVNHFIYDGWIARNGPYVHDGRRWARRGAGRDGERTVGPGLRRADVRSGGSSVV
jgi:hypothetical protein